MNTIKSTVALALLFLAGNGAALAQQKVSEGKVVYEISYENMDIPEGHEAMMPSEMVMLFKKDRSRMEMASGMGSTVYLYDHRNKTMTMLMDMMGRKFSVKHTEAELKEKKSRDDYTIEKTDKTKEIAGYSCNHAVVKSKDGSFDLYYARNIFIKDSDWANEFEGIDGFPLQYTMKQQNMSMELTATNVSTDPVPDSVFDVPEGYQEMSAEEMMRSMGGK